VLFEPSGLSQRCVIRSPADWAARLRRRHTDKHRSSRHSHLAADVTVIGPPEHASRSKIQIQKNLGQHQKAEAKKWCGSTTDACAGEELVTDLRRASDLDTHLLDDWTGILDHLGGHEERADLGLTAPFRARRRARHPLCPLLSQRRLASVKGS